MLINSSTLTGGVVLRVAAVVLFGLAGTAAYRSSRPEPPRPDRDALRVYWLCLASEVLAIPIGAAGLRSVGHGELVPAWVVLVVGVHFLPFARVFATPLFGWLGTALLALGLVGLVLGGASGSREPADWVAVVAGFVLLVVSLLGSLTAYGQAGPGPGPGDATGPGASPGPAPE